jgi:hypothetical protein
MVPMKHRGNVRLASIKPLAQFAGRFAREGDRYEILHRHAGAHERHHPAHESGRLARPRRGRHREVRVLLKQVERGKAVLCPGANAFAGVLVFFYSDHNNRKMVWSTEAGAGVSYLLGKLRAHARHILGPRGFFALDASFLLVFVAA